MMFKTTKQAALLVAFLCSMTAGLLSSPSAAAIEFDEVRDFDEVFVISAAAPSRQLVEISWAIEKNYYLYNNRFLQFAAATEGLVLGEPRIPPGTTSFDELLGEEVEKFHGRLTVGLPLLSVPAGAETIELQVRSQGCLENELCYPPSEQRVTVALPAAGSGVAAGADAAGDSWGAALFGGGASEGILGRAEDEALAPEEAFTFEAIAWDTGTALARFTARQGYYLYRDKFEFSVTAGDGFVVEAVELPPGVIKDDPEFGPVPVYYGQVEVPVRLGRAAGPAAMLELEARFQGCRDGDICYPPMARTASFEMPAAEAVLGQPLVAPAPGSEDQPPLSEQDRLAGLLTSSPAAAVFAFFLAGLLLAFTPCVFPMVPILSGIIVGQGARLTTLRAFWLSLVYVLAMSLTYTVAGVLAGLFGQNLQAVFQNPWVISGFVLIFIALALSMFGFYELQLPGRLQTRLAAASGRQQGGALWGVAVMGFLSALIVGPCVAPPLMAALIVIGSSGDALLGGTALFALSMGMGLPLIVFGVSAGKLVPRAGPWMNAVKAFFGVGLLALSIWMLERILPGGLIMLLWGALAIASGVFLGALERVEAAASGWKRLWKALGILLLILGTAEIIGSAAGGEDWTRPLERFRPVQGAGMTTEHVAFERVKSVQDLEQALARAAATGRGAMFDFYADWCIECKRMERNTFTHPDVQALLGRMQPLQADVTVHDAVDQELMQAFGVIGPPAILFFDRSGEEMQRFRLVGYFDPETFSNHLQRVLAVQ